MTKSGVTTSFRYDASGQRTTTVEGSVMTYYPFPMYEEEVNGSTVTKRSTYLLGSQAVAVRTQVNSGTATFYYLMGDHLGSASTIVQTNGTVAYQGRFLPFGGERVFPGFSSSNNPTELGFTGHHQNMELGLVYMNARFYVPGIGRFASADTVVPDPAMPQSFNRYSYVYNNPILYNDPTGHCPFCLATAIGGAIIGGVTAYGMQVADNLANGASVTDALTTNIDPTQIVAGAVIGGVVGGTLGVATVYAPVAVQAAKTLLTPAAKVTQEACPM